VIVGSYFVEWLSQKGLEASIRAENRAAYGERDESRRSGVANPLKSGNGGPKLRSKLTINGSGEPKFGSISGLRWSDPAGEAL